MLSEKHLNFSLASFGLLLSFSYLFPYHIQPLTTFYNDGLVILGGLICLAMLGMSTRPQLYLPTIVLIPLGILFVIALQLVLGVLPTDNIINLVFPALYLVCLICAMLLGASWAAIPVGAEKLSDMLSNAMLWAAIPSVMMQQVQIFRVDLSPWVLYIAPHSQPSLRAFANVAQPNNLALLLCFSLAGVWYLFQMRRFSGKIALFLSVILLWGLVLTQSRIAWLILPMYTLFVCFQSPARRVVYKWSVLLLLLYVILVLSLPIIGQYLGFEGGSVKEHVAGSSERFVLWQQAWTMAQTHPWLGVGWGGFMAEQLRIAANFPTATLGVHAHNILLNFAAELGWPVALFFLSGCVFWFWQTCLHPLQLRSETGIVIGYFSLCLIAVGAHSMVEFPLWYAYILLPTGLIMGVLHQLRWPSSGFSVKPLSLVAVSTLGCLFLAGLNMDYQRLLLSFDTWNRNQQGQVVNSEYLHPPALTLFNEYYALIPLFNLKPHAGMTQTEIFNIEKSSERFGYAPILNKLAEAYTLNQQTNKAAGVMQTLQRLHVGIYPNFYDYWQEKGKADARYQAVFITMPARNAR